MIYKICQPYLFSKSKLLGRSKFNSVQIIFINNTKLFNVQLNVLAEHHFHCRGISIKLKMNFFLYKKIIKKKKNFIIIGFELLSLVFISLKIRWIGL